MKYYLIFYMNLMFSALSDEERAVVLDRCMEPLLKLGEDKFPFAIQMSGLSLEHLARLRPKQLERLRYLVQSSNCEFIGNGYSQIIQPLIPWEVNLKNQELGMECYERVLGIRPTLATINEMAYSAGSARSFIECGYNGLIMEWNNPFKAHPEWDPSLRFTPQKVRIDHDIETNLIWCDTILFQKFQRYVYSETMLSDYIDDLTKFKNQRGVLCLYCSDAEVFDFRPSRYGIQKNPEGEWHRIRRLLEVICTRNDQLILPSEAINQFGLGGVGLQLESSWQPIPVKKQDKYNINRWALTGTDDFSFNTRCFRLAKKYSEGEPNKEDWRNLCFLWSSDLRTHIEKHRWIEANSLMDSLEEKWASNRPYERVSYNVHLKPLVKKDSNRFIKLDTKTQQLILDVQKGLSLREWSVNGQSILGTLSHGFFDDISLAADFYSCHSVIEPQGKHKISDLCMVEPWIVDDLDGHYRIRVKCNVNDYSFNKQYLISKYENEFIIDQSIEIAYRSKALIRSCHFTLIPGIWDQNTLFYESTLGGTAPEKFMLRNKSIDHSGILNQLVSSRFGFGVTTGKFRIGDKHHSILIQHDPTEAALIPHLVYLPQKNKTFMLRVIYSAQELDETFREAENPTIIRHRIKVKWV
jgi:hypothetical protein